MYIKQLRSLPLVLFIVLMHTPTHANTKEVIENTHIRLEEVCLEGHVFAIAFRQFSLSIVQVYEEVDNKVAIPQPKRCSLSHPSLLCRKSSNSGNNMAISTLIIIVIISILLFEGYVAFKRDKIVKKSVSRSFTSS